MKRVLAIFFLLQIISNNSFAEELVKMPWLFIHFYHHTYEHKDTNSFSEFLYNHYGERHDDITEHSSEHNGQDNDCRLPFKHCGDCCLMQHHYVNTFVIGNSPEGFVYPDNQIVLHAIKNDTINSYCFSYIWQPPKLA